MRREPVVNRILDNASVDRRLVEAALTKILADQEFQKNGNSAHFLKFVVGEALDGRGDRIKGFTIATSALGRQADFDPQSSSMVRVQAKRLRRLLEDYYRGPGSQELMRIELPLGSYKPQFRHLASAHDEPTAQPPEPALASRFRFALPRPPAWLVTIATCLSIATTVLFVWLTHAAAIVPPNTAASDSLFMRPPVIVVESANSATASEEAQDVTESTVAAIAGELSAFDHFVIARRSTALSAEHPVYVLSARAGPAIGDAEAFVFDLAYAPTREVVWSRTFRPINLHDAAAINDMVEAVVSMVGDIYVGAVMSDLRRRIALSGAEPRGFACIVEGDGYLLSPSWQRHRSARACAASEVADDPQDSRALSVLSTILFRDYADLRAGNEGEGDIERMETLAQRAFEIAPHRIETSLALFLSRFAARRFDEAFQLAGQFLLEMPNSRLLSAIIGVAYVSRGHYDEGAAILSRLENGYLGMPGFSIPILALAAYMRGDDTTAERLASRTSIARNSMGLVMRIVICGRKKDQTCASEASEQLRHSYPGFAADIPTALFRYAFADEIKARLLSDLRTAGFFGEPSK